MGAAGLIEATSKVSWSPLDCASAQQEAAKVKQAPRIVVRIGSISVNHNGMGVGFVTGK